MNVKNTGLNIEYTARWTSITPKLKGLAETELKRKVKKLIEEEDPRKPLTDDHLAAELKAQGINVTRRTVAKYREDMQIPSTHQRRVR